MLKLKSNPDPSHYFLIVLIIYSDSTNDELKYCLQRLITF